MSPHVLDPASEAEAEMAATARACIVAALDHSKAEHIKVTINTGAGVAETVSVPGLAPCSMSTATQPVTALRVSNQCAAGPRFRGAVVRQTVRCQ